MLELNESTFSKEIKEKAVLVDFWAPWCGPCRQVGPVLEKIAPEYDGKLAFAKVNVDQNQALAEKFDVRGIPCMIIFRNGTERTRIIGAFPEASIRRKIEEALA